MKMIAAAAVVLLSGASTVWGQAGTCADPIPLFAGVAVTGDTCTASNSLPNYGGTTSPQAELVYHFQNGTNGAGTFASGDFVFAHTGAAFGGGMFLLPAPCSNSTDPISFGNDANPMPATNMAGGTPLNESQDYYVIVTADPGGPADACGEFSLTPPNPLPVELQSFSVD